MAWTSLAVAIAWRCLIRIISHPVTHSLGHARLRPTVYNEIWELAANNVIMAAENTRNCIDGAELIVGVPVTEYDPLMECGHVSPVPRDNPPADGSRDGRAQWRHMAVRVCEDTTALQCHL